MEITDQMGRKITLQAPPTRIVSLVPSMTELLYDFGFDEEVVGITKFCVHPREWLKTKSIIGGTKKAHLRKLDELHPDFILANKEENTEEMVRQMEEKYPVYVTDINTMEEGYDAVLRLGKIFNKTTRAEELVQETKEQFSTFRKSDESNVLREKSYLYFIWLNPDMVVGGETYIHSVFENLGMINVCQGIRYPETQHHDEADYIFLSSEPYPFQEKHAPYFREKYPNSKIVLVDGEIFSWYGSRMTKIIPYVKEELLKEM